MPKTFFFFIKILIISCSFTLFAQQADSLIELVPGIGKRIGIVDKEYYGLFPRFKSFEKAELFIRDHKQLISKISYFELNQIKDTTLIQSIFVLDSLRSQINQIQEEYDNKFTSPVEVKVVTVSGDKYEGKLEMFSKRYLYLFSDKSIVTGGTSHLRVKIPVSDIEAVVVPGQSNVLLGIGIGALVGAVVGLAIGLSSAKDEKACIFTIKKEHQAICLSAFTGVIGSLAGLLFGVVSSSDDEVLGISRISDIIKLKEYAKYMPSDIVQPGVKYFQLESL